MFKKLLSFTLIFGVLLVINVTKIEASMEEYPDPFNYVAVGDGKTHILYSSSFFKIPDDPDYFELYIPRTNYNVYSATVNGVLYQSMFILYDENLAGRYARPLDILEPFRESWGSYILDSGMIDYFEINQYSYFALELVQTYSGIANPLYVEWFSERFEFSFDSEIGHDGIYEITYQIGDVLYYKYLYDILGIPDRPIDPSFPNLIFTGWYLEDGTRYDFTTPIPPDPIPRDVILTAKFKFHQPTGDGFYDNTPSSLETLLTNIGFNNVFGKLIIFVATFIIVTILLLWLKLETFIIMIVDSLIFGFFIFLGWIPLYIIIILGLIFVTGVIKTMNKGGV